MTAQLLLPSLLRTGGALSPLVANESSLSQKECDSCQLDSPPETQTRILRQFQSASKGMSESHVELK